MSYTYDFAFRQRPTSRQKNVNSKIHVGVGALCINHCDEVLMFPSYEGGKGKYTISMTIDCA